MPELSAVERNLEHLHEWVKDDEVAIHYRGRPIAVLLSEERYQEIKTDILRNSLQVGCGQADRGQFVEYDFDVLMAEADANYEKMQKEREQRDPPSYPQPKFDYQTLLDAVDKKDERYWFREVLSSTTEQPVRAAYLKDDDCDFVVMSAYEYHMLEQENLHAKLRVVIDEMLFGEPESFSINELMAEAGEGYPCSLSISESEQLRELLNVYDIRCVGSGEYTDYTVKQVLDMIKYKRQ